MIGTPHPEPGHFLASMSIKFLDASSCSAISIACAVFSSSGRHFLLVFHAGLAFVPAHITCQARACFATVTGEYHIATPILCVMVDLSMITARSDTPLKVGELIGDSPEHQLLESVIYVLAHPKDRSILSEQ
jgi:hypothetical protein